MGLAPPYLLNDDNAMITIQAKKHDNFSVEFKFGFEGKDTAELSDFAVNSWIFVPNSIGINPETYGKKQFYRDIKSNVRLITPVFGLHEIADPKALPLTSLRHAIEGLAASSGQASSDAYDYHLKMFGAIFKSSIRDFERHIRTAKALENADTLLEGYLRDVRGILSRYRALSSLMDVPQVSDTLRGRFRLVDEFLSYVTEMRTIRIIRKMESTRQAPRLAGRIDGLMSLIKEERIYKQKCGYGIVRQDMEQNRRIVYHHGMLKKFVESDLYIRLQKKKDGVAVEQLYYSIAAGVAMIFATAVAWHTQVRFGNITWPLFIVLVVSYMLKDRIKDLLRYYFAHKLGNKYYDNKAVISIGKKKVGVIREGVDFISSSKIPDSVMALRNTSARIADSTRIFEEKIILYRKRVTIDGKALAENDDYPMRGLNEIMRFHLNRYTYKMDNPVIPVATLDENGEITTEKVQKIYYLNIVFQLQHEGQSDYRRFRVVMTRDGILRIEEK